MIALARQRSRSPIGTETWPGLARAVRVNCCTFSLLSGSKPMSPLSVAIGQVRSGWRIRKAAQARLGPLPLDTHDLNWPSLAEAGSAKRRLKRSEVHAEFAQ